jgi:hypothetical protein
LYVVTNSALSVSQAEVGIVNPQVGSNQVPYIISSTGRITMFRGSIVCGAETNERQLYLSIYYGANGVLQYPFIIGQTTQSCGFAGALGIQNNTLGSIINFALPNIVLPLGSKIGITVVGINPDDYLDDIDFTITSAN